MMKSFIHIAFVLVIFLSSCVDFTELDNVIKSDFKKIYPNCEYVSHGFGEGDMAVVYVDVSFKKQGTDSLVTETWQYWDTEAGWLHRDDYLKLNNNITAIDQEIEYINNQCEKLSSERIQILHDSLIMLLKNSNSNQDVLYELIENSRVNYFPESKFKLTNEKFEKDSALRNVISPPYYGISTVLLLMNEDVLCSSNYKNDIYRLLVLNSFTRPICVRIEKKNEYCTLTAKINDGVVGYWIGQVDTIIEKKLNVASWNKLDSMVMQANYWNLPTEIEDYGFDGGNYILEGINTEKYHVTNYWSPKGNQALQGYSNTVELILKMVDEDYVQLLTPKGY